MSRGLFHIVYPLSVFGDDTKMLGRWNCESCCSSSQPEGYVFASHFPALLKGKSAQTIVCDSLAERRRLALLPSDLEASLSHSSLEWGPREVAR